MIAVATLVGVVLWLTLERTRIGVTVRAVVDDAEMARGIGIDTSRVSLGMMLAIGRGLMTNPDCLIMDEPSAGLAPIIIQHLWEIIGQLKAEGLSILLVEQNIALALKLVDYVHVISKGQIVYSANPDNSGTTSL